jgi:hypothetical protein
MGKSTKRRFESFRRGSSPKHVDQLMITQNTIQLTLWQVHFANKFLTELLKIIDLLGGLAIGTDSVRGDRKTFVISELDDSLFQGLCRCNK